MTWVEDQIDNEQIFPTLESQAFPKDFLEYAKVRACLVRVRVFLCLSAGLIDPQLYLSRPSPRLAARSLARSPASQDIYKRLFRVYAIIYHRHFGEIEALGAASHTNTSLKHFAFFAFEFSLLDDKELPALKGPIERLRGEFNTQKA